MDVQELLVLGPPAGMHVCRVAVGGAAESNRICAVGDIPDVNGRLIEVEQDLAMRRAVCTLGVLALVGDHH